MHRVMIMGMTMVVVLVMGCARPSEELVPSGTVYVYYNSEGGELLGVADGPMAIVGYVYPDKTNYVVKVCFRGRVGYVRDGPKSIRRVGSNRRSHC